MFVDFRDQPPPPPWRPEPARPRLTARQERRLARLVLFNLLLLLVGPLAGSSVVAGVAALLGQGTTVVKR
jgi:hypothetical protein